MESSIGTRFVLMVEILILHIGLDLFCLGNIMIDIEYEKCRVEQNRISTHEMTVLSILAQAYTRGATLGELQWLIDKLILDNSKTKAYDLFNGKDCVLRKYAENVKTWKRVPKQLDR